ncbi:MAG: serine/threonine protein kinase [Planctomycetota bacterium]|nr:serine/threonine protein kinase [Planctomycetota bacterium]
MTARKFEHLFGQIAIREGFVSSEKVNECLEEQARKPRGPGNRIGELMLAKRYLNAEQIRKVLDIQAKLQGEDKKRIGPYRIIGKLGQGGMGTVYLAEHVEEGRRVALKVLPPDLARDEEFLERFRREARAVASLDHPNIVRCFGVGVSGGLHYIAMEFVEGKDVESIIEERGPMSEGETLAVARQMAAALSAACTRGVVHRDIKPANILVDADGMAKLTDFGLAWRGGSDAKVTQTGVAVGTPYYISPEQARGIQDVDVRSDIYSLGASMYHMMTGQPPFPGGNAMIVMSKHVSEEPVPVRRLAPGASEGIEALIEKMLSKKPEDRQQTPEELLADITLVESGGVPSRKGKVLKRSGGKPPVHPASVGPLTGIRRIPVGAVMRKVGWDRADWTQWAIIAGLLAILAAAAIAIALLKPPRQKEDPEPRPGMGRKTSMPIGTPNAEKPAG